MPFKSQHLESRNGSSQFYVIRRQQTFFRGTKLKHEKHHNWGYERDFPENTVSCSWGGAEGWMHCCHPGRATLRLFASVTKGKKGLLQLSSKQ